jgi:hypothetical protein
MERPFTSSESQRGVKGAAESVRGPADPRASSTHRDDATVHWQSLTGAQSGRIAVPSAVGALRSGPDLTWLRLARPGCGPGPLALGPSASKLKLSATGERPPARASRWPAPHPKPRASSSGRATGRMRPLPHYPG